MNRDVTEALGAPQLAFSLSENQKKLIQEWSDEQARIVAAQQQEAIDKGARIHGELPYYGCSGGVVTFHFTPCSMGTLLSVSHAATGAKLSVSETDLF